jgi:hypothetical protein
MPTSRWSTLLVLISLAAGGPAVAAAQEGLTPQPGERVQARIVGPDTAPVGARCDGRIAAVNGDTIVLGASSRCPRGSYAADVRFSRGDRGSRLAHTGLGIVGGALAGGLFARLAAGDGCRIDGCDDGDWEVALLTIAGTGAGAVIGALVGAALPAGPQWLIGTTRRPLRVAGLEVHPEVRVSFRDRSGR